MLNELSDFIAEYWKQNPALIWNFLMSFGTIVTLWILRYSAFKIIFKATEDPKLRYHWKNGITNAYYLILIIFIGAIWIDKIGSLATFFGLLTAGLAIALQDPIVNIAGWLFIIVRKPFEVGDRIEIGDNAGDVIDIRFFQFTLNEIHNWVDADQSTGRIVHIPNGKVFKIPQANYAQGFSHIWNEIGVMVTFESNWESAKEILLKIVKKHSEHLSKSAERKLIEASKKFMIFYTSLTPIVYTSVKDSGVTLTMRYLVNPRMRRTTEHKIWEDVLKTFAAHKDIDFAYPTQRIYYNLQEGKSGTVKPPNFTDRGK